MMDGGAARSTCGKRDLRQGRGNLFYKNLRLNYVGSKVKYHICITYFVVLLVPVQREERDRTSLFDPETTHAQHPLNLP